MRFETVQRDRNGTPRDVKGRGFRLPMLDVRDGSLELLKWLGVCLMTLDHVNKYLLRGSIDWIFCSSRVVLPMFAFVLGYNLARPGALLVGMHARMVGRMCLTGAAASIPFVVLGGLGWGWWPLNVMLALALATAIVWLLELGGRLNLVGAAALFFVGGLVVEFWWPVLGLVVSVWRYRKQPSVWSLVLATASFFGLKLINGNSWAVAAIPVIFCACLLRFEIPRLRTFFYLYYPSHLAAILAARAFIS